MTLPTQVTVSTEAGIEAKTAWDSLTEAQAMYRHLRAKLVGLVEDLDFEPQLDRPGKNLSTNQLMKGSCRGHTK